MQEKRVFGYSHSRAIMAGLSHYASHQGRDLDYRFIEKPGETDLFKETIRLASEEKGKVKFLLYVDSISELAGNSLSDLKDALTAVQKAGLILRSLSEPQYDYDQYMKMICFMEDLLPEYRMKRREYAAALMYEIGTDIGTIREKTGLSESEVFQAIADYKRGQEQKTAKVQEEQTNETEPEE